MGKKKHHIRQAAISVDTCITIISIVESQSRSIYHAEAHCETMITANDNIDRIFVVVIILAQFLGYKLECALEEFRQDAPSE